MSVPLSTEEVEGRLRARGWILLSSYLGYRAKILIQHTCGVRRTTEFGNARKLKCVCEYSTTGPKPRTPAQIIRDTNALLNDRRLVSFSKDRNQYKVQHFQCNKTYWSTGARRPSKCPYCETTPEAIQQRKEATNLARYGCKNPMQSEKIKQRLQAVILKEYGVSNVKKLTTVNAKVASNLQGRFGEGITNVMHLPEVVTRSLAWRNDPVRKAECYSKVRRTSLRNFGASCFFASDKGRKILRKTWRRKHGVDNPMQLREIFDRAMQSGYRTKDYHTKDGRLLKLQGSEPVVAENLEGHGCQIRSSTASIRYSFDGRRKRYLPDLDCISALGNKVIVEVKSPYTLLRDLAKNLAKFRAANRYTRERGMRFTLALVLKDSIRYINFPTKRELQPWLI